MLQAHTQRVESLCFSANGEAVASSSRSAGLRVFDAASMKLIAHLEGHRGAVHTAVFSPDNSRLFSGSADKTCRAWGVCTSLELLDPMYVHERQEHHFGSVRSLAFGPDMGTVATGSEDCVVKIWDAFSEINVTSANGHLGPVFCVDVSPDGSLVVSGSHDNTVRVWDARTGQERGVFEVCMPSHHLSPLPYSPPSVPNYFDGSGQSIFSIVFSLVAPWSNFLFFISYSIFRNLPSSRF
jgi:WD40 repeat protein